MKKIVFLFVFISGNLLAQNEVVTLNDCYENMLVNYPIADQTELYKQSNQLSLKNHQASWLPSANLNARATYQSDAIEVNISAMGNDFGFAAEKDQYQASIDINQLIYDWGRIKSAKQLSNAELKVNEQNTLVELNKIKEQVNLFYFSILILQRNEELMNTMLVDIENREKTVESAVENGVRLKSDLNILKAEKLKVKQSITQIMNQRLAAIQILAEITGMNLSSDLSLEIPNYEINNDNKLFRPEHQLFDYRTEQVGVSSKLVAKQSAPMFYSFAQVGYGKPGLNMTNTEFDSFYMVGVGLSWNFWDWNQTKRKKEITLLNKDFINTQRKTFDKHLAVALDNELANIATLQSALVSDIEIIKLREEVTKSARSKLDNGVITSTDYITELNAETQAKISYETHKIQMIQSKVNYLYIKGEL